MEFRQFLKDFGYSNKSFSEKYAIKIRTVENWSYRGCPEFVLTLLYELEECRKEIKTLQAENMRLHNLVFGGVQDDKEEYKVKLE